MNRWFARVATVALLVSVVPLPAAAAAGTASVERVLVLLSSDAGPPQHVADDVVARFGGQRGFVYSHALGGFSASLPAAAINALRNNPSVLSVTQDRLVSIAQDVPTGYDRVEADLRAGGGTSASVDVDIAVLDTGVASHPDLNVVARTDCSVAVFPGFGCYNGEGQDVHGHGTHVAGTAAAIDNDIGLVGVAPGARIHSVKVLMDNGTGYLSAIVAGIDWVTARASTIEVANMSLGWVGGSDPAVDAAVAGAVDAGVTMVVAAGNSNIDAAGFQPAAHPDVIAVSAVADADGAAGGLSGFRCRQGEVDDTLASFSNWGSVVDIAAPGVCITSTYPGGGYAVASGTSMASPHVAGAAALYLALNGRDLDDSDSVGRGDVEAVKAALVSAGHAQGSTCGFTGDRDAFPEPLLFVNDPAFGGTGACEVEQVDPTPPTAPGSFTAQADGYPVSLSWSAADDPDSGILEYRIHRNGELLTTVGHTATSYQDRATAPGTEYSYQVQAVNLQFGVAASETVAATTSSDDPTDAGWWGFDETSGTVAEDSSAWRRAGSLVNGPGRVTGAVGGAVQLDGSDDRVDLDPAVLDGASDVTFTLWFRTLKTGTQTLVSGANAGNDNEVLLQLASPTDLRYFVGYNTSFGVAWTLPYSVADGEWHHLAVIRNQTLGQAWAYLDGSVVGGWGVASQYLQNLDVDFLTLGQDQDTVGGGFQSSEAFSGMLDEVRLYTRVLTGSEISDLAGDQPPAAPTGVDAADGVGAVTVSWDVIAGLEYSVERATDIGGPYTEIAAGVTASLYEDLGLAPGTYHYRVVASDPVAELTSEPSAPVSAQALPPTPTGLSATPGVEQVALTWDAVTGATYNVYRAANGGVATSVASALTGPSYLDTDVIAGTAYTYTVTAVVNTVESAPSSPVDAVPEAGAGDPVPLYATSQATFAGSVASGDLTSLQADDGDVQVLREQHNGGKPINRVSSLDHRWTFELGSAVGQHLVIDGFRPANDEFDDFHFSISVNGGPFGAVLHTINNPDAATFTVGLPADVTGTVIVRVVDTNRVQGSSVLDELHLDQLYVLVIGSGDPQPPPDPDPDPPTGTYLPASETTSFGTTIGSLSDVQVSDDVYEVINEEAWAGGSRTRLEHTWTFEVPAASLMTLTIEAVATGGEDFDILYSHDGSSWALGLVVGSTEDSQSVTIGSSTGVVHVRVVDQDRNRGDTTISSIRVDYLAITVG